MMITTTPGRASRAGLTSLRPSSSTNFSSNKLTTRQWGVGGRDQEVGK